MGLCFWFFLLVALITFFFGDLMILKIFGSEYVEASSALKIYAFAGIIVSMNVFFAQRFILLQKNYIYLYGSIAGALSNILLNCYLIPKIGINGAAWATLISYLLPNIIVSIFFKLQVRQIFCSSIYYIFTVKSFKH